MPVLSSISKLTSSPGRADVAALQARINELTRVNQELQEALHAAQTGSISMQGFLNKHRPVTQLMGLFAQEWELRYFILTGSVLRYYKSERDAAFAPRGVVDVQGCYMETEESSDRAWRFRVVSPAGDVLLRLGTDNRAAAERWMACLEAAGAQLNPNPALRPGPHGTSGTSPAPSGSCPDRIQQDRWEACSTDSELPEVVSKGTAAAARLRAAAGAGAAAAGRPPIHPSTTAAAAAAAVARATTSSSRTEEVEVSSRPAAAAAGEVGAAAAAAAPGERISGQKTAAVAAVERPPMLGSTPLHTAVRYSYLSSEGVWAAKHDGLLNLGIIILVAANFRLILENLLKYGWRLNFISYVRRSLAGSGNLPLVLAFPALLLFSLIALATECLGSYCLKVEEQYKEALAKKGVSAKAAAKLYESRVTRTEVLLFVLNTVNTTAALVLPCLVIHWTQADAAPALLLTLCTLTVWMKLVSYAHCHHDLRAAHRANQLRPGERGAPESNPSWATLRFPENLTVNNMLYYLAVPTLTYQVNFPRSAKIRKRWLLRRLLELACFSGLLLFMINQYMEPAVSNAIMPLSQSDWVRVAERVLKLALPNLYCWLCTFYCLFHLWLNILGELTRFGDREFYKDWWNAATIGDYWRTWNMPVHRFLLRTVYFPAMRAGLGRYWSMVLVFFVSAVAHELAVGVPLHMVKMWSFWGIMLQVPLISITDKLRKRLKRDTWGNYMFWITFCMVGQPVSLLLYYHDYVFNNSAHGGVQPQLQPLLVDNATCSSAPGSDYLCEA